MYMILIYTVFLDVTLYNLVKNYRRFGGTCSFQIYGRLSWKRSNRLLRQIGTNQTTRRHFLVYHNFYTQHHEYLKCQMSYLTFWKLISV